MHHETADRVAVEACLAGDREAFAALVARHQEAAFRAAYLIVRDEHGARDVAQEGLIRAYRNLHRYRTDGPLRPWLLRIVTNLALNEVRGRSRRRHLLERFGRLATAPRAGPAEELDRGDAQHQLWDAINSLPESDRAVLYLRHYLDLPEAEIAAAIGKRPGTVKSRLSRASARLRSVIERDYPDLVPSRPVPGGFDGPRR